MGFWGNGATLLIILVAIKYMDPQHGVLHGLGEALFGESGIQPNREERPGGI